MKFNLIDNVTCNIILKISKNIYTSKLAKELGVTHTHVTKIVGILEEEKIINKNIKGREKIITLTEKGLAIQENLIKLNSLING